MDRSSSIRAEKLLGSTELPENLLNKTLLPVSLDIAGIVSVRRVIYIIIIYSAVLDENECLPHVCAITEIYCLH